MQLSHIRKHLLGHGIGFRQIMDYAVLLRSSLESERAEVSRALAATGLKPMAGALMWVLSECLGLKDEYLLCAPDSSRGRVLLGELSDDGNFGKNAGTGCICCGCFLLIFRRFLGSCSVTGACSCTIYPGEFTFCINTRNKKIPAFAGMTIRKSGMTFKV